LRFQGTCYRAHDPRWAFSPLSGEGAKAHGARFNPKGTPALYLALTIEGMFAEMGHGLPRRFDPLTVCAYEVDVSDLVDLRTDDDQRAAGYGLAQLGCSWASDLAGGREPSSWQVARELIDADRAGVLVPSFAVGAKDGMANLVLWKCQDTLPYLVKVHDPDGRLSKNQDSWT
jgi:RES domain-containing protein